jgi:Zn-dependent protease
VPLKATATALEIPQSMLELIKGANLLLRFLLELCALDALGYWGFKTSNATITKIVLGVGAPLGGCGRVGIFVSPRASVQLPGLLVLLLQGLVFGSAAAALVATGHRTLALVFAVIVVINAILMYVWGQ